MKEEKIITRFAPSPTGELHIGGARTALFEYLAAKHSGGKFFLRIEDTDRARFVEGSDKRIEWALKWLGLVPDNMDTVVYQSKRLEIYQKHAFDLVKAGHAYVCTCSKEELTKEREKQEKAGLPPRYSGKCRNIENSEGSFPKGAVIRMKMPEKGKIIVHDLIRGDVDFDLSLLDDQVLLKSDSYPTYHLASVIDDHEMKINSVIRAEEWLSSTPKHLILYKMFGWEAPQFAHLPMVLAPDHSKLSKRHGATSVVEYKELGYLPEAIVNFLVMQGWNPKNEREKFTLEELIAEFKLENVNKAPAVFNIEKLNSINEYYISQKIRSSKSEIRNNFKDFNVQNISDGELDLLGRGGFKTLKEAADYILSLREEPKYAAEILIFRKSEKKDTLLALEQVSSKLVSLQEWNSNNIQKALEYTVIENGLTNGDVFWPVRVALSGAEKSPSPVELAVALSKDESMKRIQTAIKKLS